MGTSEAIVAKASRVVPADRVVTARGDRRDAVLDLIRSARSRITLSLFRCSEKAVFGELTAAVERGVDVEVLVTSRAKGGQKKLRKLWRRLEHTGATVRAYTDAVVKYHAKYMVVDDGPALIATLNFTPKCFDETCDAIVMTHDPAVISGLRALMDADRQGDPAPQGITDRLIIGPERARRQVTGLIRDAKKSIRVIDAKLSDPGLIDLMNARRAEGVVVEVFGGKMIGGMRSHGKMMLVDGTTALLGSMALTALSLDFRREVALRIDDPAAVGEIESLFSSIAAAAGANGGAPAVAAGGV